MRYSERMVLESTIRKHVPGVSTLETEGCALQLAGILDKSGHWSSRKALDFFCTQDKMNIPCPQCGSIQTLFAVVAAHLNDMHKWNIDQIAEYFDQFEKKEELAREEENKDLVEMCL